MWLSDTEVDFVQQMRDMCETVLSNCLSVISVFSEIFCYDRYADKVSTQNQTEVHLTTYCACNAVLCRLISMKF